MNPLRKPRLSHGFVPPDADANLMKLSKPFGLDELQAAVDKAAN